MNVQNQRLDRFHLKEALAQQDADIQTGQFIKSMALAKQADALKVGRRARCTPYPLTPAPSNPHARNPATLKNPLPSRTPSALSSLPPPCAASHGHAAAACQGAAGQGHRRP